MDDAQEKAAKPNLKLRIGGPLLLVLLGCVAYWNRNPDLTMTIQPGDDTPPPIPSGINDPRTDPRPEPSVAALLGGLKVGQIVDPGWKVAAISISTKKEVPGALTVYLTKGTKSFAVWILPKGQLRGPAPYETDRYAIYTGLLFEADQVDMMRPVETVVEYVRYGEQNGGSMPGASAASPSASAAPAPP